MQVGKEAPTFTLKDQTGKAINLASYRGKQPVVLIFYPADETPGCTKQMCAARDDNALYEQAGVAVFGVNPGTAESHRSFVANHSLTTPLLVDEGLKVAGDYDALTTWQGQPSVNRTVVGIAADGRIAFYERGIPATSQILAVFKERHDEQPT